MIEVDALGQPLVVEDLDAEWLLDLLEEAKVSSRVADRSKLRLAVQWCVLHPATAESGVATWEHPALAGVLEADESLGGEGTPAVRAFAVEPLAASLGISTRAAMALVADALDLQFRLPGVWALVEVLEVEPHKARRVAQLTHGLSRAAAAQVDADLAPVLAGCTWAAVERAVAHAIARHHPELLAEKERRGKDSWDVTISHPTATEFAGTSYLEASGDTLDLTLIYDRVCEIAAELKAGGDEDALGARKAKALGILAAQGAEQDLIALTGAAPAATTRSAKPRKPRTRLYLHASITELLGLGAIETASGDVERLGAATIEKIREWVGRSDVTITPVLDPDRTWAADGHEPPERMREAVILRDGHCVFPWCQIDARHADLDHIDPYVPMDEGGPPGQTRPENLAPLCRRHHRCKTSGRWRYRRRPDGTYAWHGPHGRSYLVTPFGTLPLNPN